MERYRIFAAMPLCLFLKKLPPVKEEKPGGNTPKERRLSQNFTATTGQKQIDPQRERAPGCFILEKRSHLLSRHLDAHHGPAQSEFTLFFVRPPAKQVLLC